jgi:hypothetical protein
MNRFISNLPSSFPVAGGEVRLRGALVQIDETTGRRREITRVNEPGPTQPPPQRTSQRSISKMRHRRNRLETVELTANCSRSRFELSKEYQRLIEIYEQILCFYFNRGFDLCVSQVCQAAEKKNPEANKLAVEGAKAAKNQDFDKAVDLLKKATGMDKNMATSSRRFINNAHMPLQKTKDMGTPSTTTTKRLN